MKRVSIAALALVVLVAALAFSGASAQPASVKLGLAAAVSGGSAASGEAIRRAARRAGTLDG